MSASREHARGNFLRAQAGGWELLLEMCRIRAIESPDRLQRNPRRGQPLGWLLDAGGEVPVFHLANLLGSGAVERGEPGAILRLGEGPEAWALALDALGHPVQAGPADRQSLPRLEGRPLSHLCREVVWVGQRPLPVLDPAALRRPAAERPGEAPAGRPRPVAAGGPAAGGQPMAGGRRILLCSTRAPVDGARPHLFGIGLRQVAEVLNPVPLVPVPGTATFVRGLVPWRRRPVPVLDLSRRLGLGESSPGPAHRLLVLRSLRGEACCGLEVRAELRVESLPLPCRPLAGEPFAAAPVLGAFDLSGQTLLIPDVGALVQGVEPDPAPDADGPAAAARSARHENGLRPGPTP